ncbi:MAG TPA: NADH-quinone oxidoreductase subunit C [bacterium]
MIVEIFESLRAQFPDARMELKEEKPYPWIFLQSEIIRLVCGHLKTVSGFGYLSSLSGVDRADCFEIVYHLTSIGSKKNITLKVRVAKNSPSVESIEPVYPSAGFFEREVFEMLGIKFEGNKDLRRLLLPEDWQGYPLRKDYKYPAEYHGIIHERGGSVDRTKKGNK